MTLNITKGYSTACPPNQPKKRKSPKKNHQSNTLTFLKRELKHISLSVKGNKNKTRRAANIHITPPSLSGTALNIA